MFVEKSVKSEGKKKMTRNECENKIVEKLIEIAEIYNQYNPHDDYLSMTIQGNNISANNAYFEKSHEGGTINFVMFDYNKDEEVYHREH